MPSPLAHCTSLAELQVLIARAARAHPDLGFRAQAAGGLIALEAVEPDARLRRFAVEDPLDGRCAVDLLEGTCPCSDRAAPILRGTRVCAHVLACLVLKHLAQRARHLLAFLPPEPSPSWAADEMVAGGAWSDDPGERCRPGRPRERPFWDAESDEAPPRRGSCRHRIFIHTPQGARCLGCDRPPGSRAEFDRSEDDG